MIEKKDVEYVAWLARLELSEEEKELFTRQLGQVLEHAEKISALRLEDVEPTSHAIPMSNVMREDEARPGLTQEEEIGRAHV